VPRSAQLDDGTPSRVRVVAGILQDVNGAVLIADRARCRSMTEYWEFPGGKVAAGESAEAALERELLEELGIGIGAVKHVHCIEHDYADLKVAIDFFLVAEWTGTPAGREGQQLRWVSRSALGRARLLPADAPIVELIRESGSPSPKS